MSRPAIGVIGVSVVLVLMLGTILASLAVGRRRDLVRRRLGQVAVGAGRRGADPASARAAQSRWLRAAAAIGTVLARSGVLPAATLKELRNSLGNTSLAGANGVTIFIGAKASAMGFGLITVSFLTRTMSLGFASHLLLPMAGAAVGMVAPDYVLRRMRRTYVAGVEAGLPDALDMMVICSEAGLALEPAIERVSVELGTVHPTVAREFSLTAQEMRLIADRTQVLTNLGRRTGVEDLHRLGSTLIQTVQFGTPVTQALRTLAVEMRQEAITRYEGRAAQLSVFLTLPMILFILPSVFIIVGGPAAIQVIHALGKG